jgi:hypothetical protein
MSSNKWVANRVVDWLREKLELGHRELQDRLKKRYSIDVPYSCSRKAESTRHDIRKVGR